MLCHLFALQVWNILKRGSFPFRVPRLRLLRSHGDDSGVSARMTLACLSAVHQPNIGPSTKLKPSNNECCQTNRVTPLTCTHILIMVRRSGLDCLPKDCG